MSARIGVGMLTASWNMAALRAQVGADEAVDWVRQFDGEGVESGGDDAVGVCGDLAGKGTHARKPAPAWLRMVLPIVPLLHALGCEDPRPDESQSGQHPIRGPGQGVRALLRPTAHQRRFGTPYSRRRGRVTHERTSRTITAKAKPCQVRQVRAGIDKKEVAR